MWIEVIGLPGIGKTTAINRQLHRLRTACEIVISQKSEITNSIRSRLYMMKYKGAISDEKLLNSLSYRLSFRPIFKRQKPVFFFDSGLLQILIENLIETNFEDQQQKLDFFKKQTVPDMLFYFEDEKNVAVERELKRVDRLYDLNEEELSERYDRVGKIIESELLPLASKLYRIGHSNHDDFIRIIENEKTR